VDAALSSRAPSAFNSPFSAMPDQCAPTAAMAIWSWSRPAAGSAKTWRICRVMQLAEYQIVWFNFCAKSDFLDKGKLTI
jgi:hypothetical protein